MTDESRIESIRRIVERHRALPGAMLPILHAIQGQFGWVPEEGVPVIAAALKRSRAEVHGVISFYPHFRTHAPGRHVVQICRAESCRAMGAEALEAHAKATLGIDFGHTTSDRAVTLEAVYCLGNCACSPAIRIDDEIVGRVDGARFDALVAALRDEETAA